MSGAGNLFTVIDNRNGLLSAAQASVLSPQLCEAQHTIGKRTEGVLLIQKPTRVNDDFDVLFFNPDGSTSMMCGNGSRCAVRFADTIGLLAVLRRPIQFTMAGDSYSASFDSNEVDVLFAPPRQIQANVSLSFGNFDIRVDYINVGSDHVVLLEHELHRVIGTIPSEESIRLLAQHIRHHPLFERGTNVNFVRDDGDIVHLRTYERGVEDFTGACGTGALATGVSLFLRELHQRKEYRIVPPSGEQLRVRIENSSKANSNDITALHLIGPARIIGVSIFHTDT